MMKREMGEARFDECKNKPHYFEMFLSEAGKKRLARIVSLEPCIHLGEETGRIECPSCSGTVRVKTFACEIHGECTLSKALNELACCAGCAEYQIVDRAKTNIKWAYGITTVPERLNELFPRTLESLRNSGFCNPWVFVDGAKDSSAYKKFGTGVTVRYPNIKTLGNWMLSLWEIYIRIPDADRYAIFQDDFVTYPDLRQYLDLCDYPPKGYWNLYTFPDNQKLCPKNFTGWYRTRQKGWGAVALVFSLDAMTTLLGHHYMVQKPKEKRRKHRAIDFVVATIMQRAGWKEFVHNPSLVQHTGIKSSMGNGQQPLATSFRGEDFSAMELVPK